MEGAERTSNRVIEEIKNISSGLHASEVYRENKLYVHKVSDRRPGGRQFYEFW